MTIAGSDPSGGAGIQADLKTFHQFGVYGEAVLTLLTVQNTMRVDRVECLAPDLVVAQAEAVLEDIPPAAIKTGALGNAAIVAAVADLVSRLDIPVVVDPVMISKHGSPLLSGQAQDAMKDRLLPPSQVDTPNLPEAEVLTGKPVRGIPGMKKACRELAQMGAHAVLIKGGHADGPAVDVLFVDGDWIECPAPRFDTPHTHGTGCTFSAAITAGLALGQDLPAAVLRAKSFISAAIAANPGLGSGSGPVNHHVPVEAPR